jgi:hypothetical protein
MTHDEKASQMLDPFRFHATKSHKVPCTFASTRNAAILPTAIVHFCKTRIFYRHSCLASLDPSRVPQTSHLQFFDQLDDSDAWDEETDDADPMPEAFA